MRESWWTIPHMCISIGDDNMSNQLFRELTSNKNVPLYQFCIERIFRGLKEKEDEVIIHDSDYFEVIGKLLLSNEHISAAVDYDISFVHSALDSSGKEASPDVCYALIEITNNLLNYYDNHSFGDEDFEHTKLLFLEQIEKDERLLLQTGECVFADQQDCDSSFFNSYYALLTLLVGIRVISIKASNKPLKAETKSIIKSFSRILDYEVQYALHSFSNLVPLGEIPVINRRLDRLPFVNAENEAEYYKQANALDLQKASLQVLCRGLLRFLAKKDTLGIILEEGYNCAVLS
ncbi:MAG: hypothetical protein K6G81_05000, partial [Lachnospiraceae bacterium]|nr:hypothetical protein [Lachnospiraceae bacterium]